MEIQQDASVNRDGERERRARERRNDECVVGVGVVVEEEVADGDTEVSIDRSSTHMLSIEAYEDGEIVDDDDTDDVGARRGADVVIIIIISNLAQLAATAAATHSTDSNVRIRVKSTVTPPSTAARALLLLLL